MVPIAIFWGGRRNAIRTLTGLGIALAIVWVPYLLLQGADPLGPFHFYASRGIQIESLSAGVIGFVRSLGVPASVSYSYGSDNLVDPMASAVLRLLTPIQVIALGATCTAAVVRFTRRGGHTLQDRSGLIVGCTCAVLALMLTSRVLSTQYIVWLVPFLALLCSRNRWLAALALVICLLTTLIYPVLYLNLVAQDLGALALLNARNFLLVVVLFWAFTELLRRPSLSQSHAFVADVAEKTRAAPNANVGQ